MIIAKCKLRISNWQFAFWSLQTDSPSPPSPLPEAGERGVREAVLEDGGDEALQS